MSSQGQDDDGEHREPDSEPSPAEDAELEEMRQRPPEEVEEIAADDDHPLQETAQRLQRHVAGQLSGMTAGLQPKLDAITRMANIQEQLAALQPKIKLPGVPRPGYRLYKPPEFQMPDVPGLRAVTADREAMLEEMEEAQAANAELQQQQEKAQQEQIDLLTTMVESTVELVQQHKAGEARATRHGRIAIAVAVVTGVGGMVASVLGLMLGP